MSFVKQMVMGTTLLAGAFFTNVTKAQAQQNGKVEEIDFANGRKGYVTWANTAKDTKPEQPVSKKEHKSKRKILKSLIPGISPKSWDITDLNIDENGIITLEMDAKTIEDVLNKASPDSKNVFSHAFMKASFIDDGNGVLSSSDSLFHHNWRICSIDKESRAARFLTIDRNMEKPTMFAINYEAFNFDDVIFYKDDRGKVVDAQAVKPPLESFKTEVELAGSTNGQKTSSIITAWAEAVLSLKNGQPSKRDQLVVDFYSVGKNTNPEQNSGNTRVYQQQSPKLKD